jgi:hypothetical protein
MEAFRYMSSILFLLIQISAFAQPVNEYQVEGNFFSPLYISLFLNFLLITAGLTFYYFRRNKLFLHNTESPDQIGTEKNQFDFYEKAVLGKMIYSSHHDISLAEVDQVIGTGAKSIHHQNRKRSVLIRSINMKYKDLTKDDSPLITSVRIKDDRRMHRYKIDAGKYERVKQLLAD